MVVLWTRGSRFSHLTICRHYYAHRRSIDHREVRQVEIRGTPYPTDEVTNVNFKVISLANRSPSLHLAPSQPLYFVKQRLVNHFHATYHKRYARSPLFTVVDNLSPVVTTNQNFDSLLVPTDHVSRAPHDTYYINADHVLRSHTSAHQNDLIRAGFDAFLVVGDSYRRDDVDREHYPCFHQMEGVRLYDSYDLYGDDKGGNAHRLLVDKAQTRTPACQEWHTMETARAVEEELKGALEAAFASLFGSELQTRWVDAYFPFTHPSWELEVLAERGDAENEADWVEVCGCGIVEQALLRNAGAGNKVGWAFGLGLERLAMHLFKIPDIRLFWSNDPAFTRQFETDDVNADIKFEPISTNRPHSLDLSFFVPAEVDIDGLKADFCDFIRISGDDRVENVTLLDEFEHVGSGRRSLTYRMTYRHMTKKLSKEQCKKLHTSLTDYVVKNFAVVPRI